MTDAEKAVLKDVAERLEDLFHDVNYPVSQAGAVPVEKIQRELLDLHKQLLDLIPRR